MLAREDRDERAAPLTLAAALVEQATLSAERPAFTLLDLDGRRESLSYNELYARALRAATFLRQRGLRQGDRVLICLPTSVELLLSIYGVMLAGGVCVPVYPPTASHDLRRWRERMRSVSRVTQPAGAIVAAAGRLHVAAVLEQEHEGLFVLTPEQFRDSGADEPAQVLPEDLAFIQFTSGTTHEPRGVSVSHAALLANIRAMLSVMQLSPSDRSVSWLPPYHDMGLVGHVFVPVVCGAHQVLMPPALLVRDPGNWLALIGELKATQTTAPNFAYSMCVRRVPPERIRELDLSTLRWALNGAELVQAETVNRFCDAFAPAGFSPDALCPVYGLAEATLAATFSQRGGPRIDLVQRSALARDGRAEPAAEGELDSQAFVAVGEPMPGHELELRRRDGSCCDERQVGEIWLRGPSVMSGYFNNPQGTAAALRDGWLATGDLGYRADGLLYVTGRRKELIIQHGRNYLPQDFEAACLYVPGLRPGRAVAFGLPNHHTGTEDLVLVAEVRQRRRLDDAGLARRAAETVGQHTGLRPNRVELLAPGALPKTTSGKLQRSRVRAAYAAGRGLQPPQPSRTETLRVSARSLLDLALARARRLFGWR